MDVSQGFHIGPANNYLLDLMLIISPEILEEGTLDPANNRKDKL